MQVGLDRDRRADRGHDMSEYYVLDEHGDPIPVEDHLIWARWFESHTEARRLAEDRLPDGRRVSTVFLGLDHQLVDGPPLFFETMAFDPDGTSLNWRRSTTRAQALDGHAALLAALLGFSAAHEG